MLKIMLPLVSRVNGTIMIGVFVAVCIGLVVMLMLFLNSGKKKKE